VRHCRRTRTRSKPAAASFCNYSGIHRLYNTRVVASSCSSPRSSIHSCHRHMFVFVFAAAAAVCGLRATTVVRPPLQSCHAARACVARSVYVVGRRGRDPAVRQRDRITPLRVGRLGAASSGLCDLCFSRSFVSSVPSVPFSSPRAHMPRCGACVACRVMCRWHRCFHSGSS